jgi:hypothetical protein
MGKLASIKTKPTEVNVEDFINSIADEQKRRDCFIIMQLMQQATKQAPKIWGSSIIGFGDRRYKSPATEREVDWFIIGFAPRKANITLYLMNMASHADALSKLGKHKIGGGCLYINKLADVDQKVLAGMIKEAVARKK